MREIENNRNQEINQIKEKDPEKKKILVQSIHKRFNDQLRIKASEEQKSTRACFYCEGVGRRYVTYY